VGRAGCIRDLLGPAESESIIPPSSPLFEAASFIFCRPRLWDWYCEVAIRMRVKVARFFVQRMKTKWGSCNPGNRSIRLNTDLAKKPRELLEYIIVHEMAHLLVRHHDETLVGLMDRNLPNWKSLRQTLNNFPLAHTEWVY
jgi:predicted metal-dependent hydrolase